MIDSSKEFRLSSSLRKQVREALTDDMVNSAGYEDGDSIRTLIRHGFIGVENLSDKQLIEDYSDWRGLSDESDFLNDPLIRRIVDEQGTDAFEREFLGKS